MKPGDVTSFRASRAGLGTPRSWPFAPAYDLSSGPGARFAGKIVWLGSDLPFVVVARMDDYAYVLTEKGPRWTINQET